MRAGTVMKNRNGPVRATWADTNRFFHSQDSTSGYGYYTPYEELTRICQFVICVGYNFYEKKPTQILTTTASSLLGKLTPQFNYFQQTQIYSNVLIVCSLCIV